jgi:hypothetical protein
MKVLFEQLVSPEQKQLSDLINAKGGIKALQNKDKMLLDLEKAASKASGLPSVEGLRTRQAKPGDADLEINILRETSWRIPMLRRRRIGSCSPASSKHKRIRSSTNSRLLSSGRVTESFKS